MTGTFILFMRNNNAIVVLMRMICVAFELEVILPLLDTLNSEITRQLLTVFTHF